MLGTERYQVRKMMDSNDDMVQEVQQVLYTLFDMCINGRDINSGKIVLVFSRVDHCGDGGIS